MFAVAAAGLLVGVAPSSLPLYSVVAGYVGGRESGRAKGAILAAAFVLGIATVDAAIGVLFGFAGVAVVIALARHLGITYLALAAIVAFLGLALLGRIRIALPVLRPNARPVDTVIAAYGLGVPFGLTTCPACTPLVLPVLGAAAATGSPWIGGLLMFLFGLARGVPLVFVGAAAQAMRRVPRASGWVPKVEQAAGVLLLLSALLFLYLAAAYLGFVPPLRVLIGVDLGG